MSTVNYDVILFAEHGLNQKNIEVDHSWHYWMCMNSCGTLSRLSYNIHDNKNDERKGPWSQYGGTGFTINEKLKAIKADHCDDSFNAGRWSWVKIEGKDKKFTVFISAYRPYKNTAGINSVWNQQVRFFQKENQYQEPDILDNFDIQLCHFIDNL